MKDYKTPLLFSIPYFTVCSGIYHLAFWSSFNINGLAYIGISDIIKSSVYPFVSLFFIFVMGMLLHEVIFKTEEIFPSGGGRNTYLGKKLNTDIGIRLNLFIWLLIIVVLYYKNNVYGWITWAALTGIVPTIYLDRIGFLTEQINNRKFRRIIIWSIVYIPIFSFASGKYQSQLIYQNINYKFTIRQKIDCNSNTLKIDTLKFIGNTEKQIFLTDLNNSTVFILRADNIDTLSLKQHKDK